MFNPEQTRFAVSCMTITPGLCQEIEDQQFLSDLRSVRPDLYGTLDDESLIAGLRQLTASVVRA